MDLNELSVKTISGDVFTGEESARLAALIYKRFGYDVPLAAKKWREMLGSNVSDARFSELAKQGCIADRPELEYMQENGCVVVRECLTANEVARFTPNAKFTMKEAEDAAEAFTGAYHNYIR